MQSLTLSLVFWLVLATLVGLSSADVVYVQVSLRNKKVANVSQISREESTISNTFRQAAFAIANIYDQNEVVFEENLDADFVDLQANHYNVTIQTDVINRPIDNFEELKPTLMEICNYLMNSFEDQHEETAYRETTTITGEAPIILGKSIVHVQLNGTIDHRLIRLPHKDPNKNYNLKNKTIRFTEIINKKIDGSPFSPLENNAVNGEYVLVIESSHSKYLPEMRSFVDKFINDYQVKGIAFFKSVYIFNGPSLHEVTKIRFRIDEQKLFPFHEHTIG